MRIFLSFVAAVYFVAFWSISVQVDDLYGADGLLPKDYPTPSVVSSVRKHLNYSPDRAGGSSSMLYVLNPDTLLALQTAAEKDGAWRPERAVEAVFNLGAFLGMAPQRWFEWLAVFGCGVAGTAIALLLITPRLFGEQRLRFTQSFLLAVAFATLYALYGGFLEHVGDTFYYFQWDILLTEIGFLSILAAVALPLCENGPTLVSWMVKLTAFKLLFLSGVVKVQSGCPTWLHLTALEYHYATQCIPTPLAPFAHALPPYIQSFSVAITLILQVVVSLLFLLPVPVPGAAFAHVFQQVLIAATGNYNFFNLLTAVMAAEAGNGANPFKKLIGRGPGKWRCAYNQLTMVVAFGTVVSVLYFNFTNVWPAPFSVDGLWALLWGWKLPTERVKPLITLQQFDAALGLWLIPVAAVAAASSFVLVIFTDFAKIVTQRRGPSVLSVPKLFIYLVIVLFSVALISVDLKLIDSHNRSGQSRQITQDISKGFDSVQQLVISGAKNVLEEKMANQLGRRIARWWDTAQATRHQYGLFRHMTGVGNKPGTPTRVARPEVIIEGSANGKVWHEYDFYYKPGNVTRPLPVVAPHQPRLDWQMWFAALSPNAPHWLAHYIYLLLDGRPLSSKVVPPPPEPFLTRPPKYIRVWLYKYDFAKDKKHGVVWKRGDKQPYIPAVELQSQQLKQFIAQQGWDTESRKRKSEARKFLSSQPIAVWEPITIASFVLSMPLWILCLLF